MHTNLLKKHWQFVLIMATMLAGCKVMLIGAYDQVTDEGIQKIQTDVSTLFVKIQKNFDDTLPAQNKYANFKDTYDNIEGEIKSLAIRANSLPKYSIIKNQIIALNASVLDLEALNKTLDSTKVTKGNVFLIHIADSTFSVEFGAMVALQNGLKREKTPNSKTSTKTN